ncbi:MAG: hypothetical protein VW499_04030, partial [Candidatus Puniceispirillum sp.]
PALAPDMVAIWTNNAVIFIAGRPAMVDFTQHTVYSRAIAQRLGVVSVTVRQKGIQRCLPHRFPNI